jgi:D-sedoheptulose 7-phosphate isomerase
VNFTLLSTGAVDLSEQITMAHLPLTLLARQAFIQDELNASAQTKTRIFEQCTRDIIRAVDTIIGAYNRRKKLLLCGNGGSAADAQHLATEMVIRMNPAIKRPGLPAIALTADSTLLTAGANDIGYDQVFSRSVEALGEEGDVLIALSTSGNSESVNNALRMARQRKLASIALGGRDGGAMKPLADISIIVPSNDTARIQEGHITIGHIIFAMVENEMYGGR